MKKNVGVILRFFEALSLTCMILSVFVSPASIGQLFVSQALQSQGQAAHAAAACVSPPANFNPLTASNAQLAQYNLPPKPTSSASYAIWKRMVQGAKQQICRAAAKPASFKSTGGARVSTKVSTQPSIDFSPSRSGYEVLANQNNGTVTQAYGEWDIPCNFSSNPTGRAASVVEIGTATNNLDYLIGVTEDATKGHQFVWSEDNGIHYLSDYSLSCPDHILADILFDFTSDTLTRFIEDTTAHRYLSLADKNSLLAGSSYAQWGEARFYNKSSSAVYPLYNFDRVSWENVQVESIRPGGAASVLGPIGARGDTVPVHMGTQAHDLAVPSALNADNASFEDLFYASN